VSIVEIIPFEIKFEMTVFETKIVSRKKFRKCHFRVSNYCFGASYEILLLTGSKLIANVDPGSKDLGRSACSTILDKRFFTLQ